MQVFFYQSDIPVSHIFYQLDQIDLDAILSTRVPSLGGKADHSHKHYAWTHGA